MSAALSPAAAGEATYLGTLGWRNSSTHHVRHTAIAFACFTKGSVNHCSSQRATPWHVHTSLATWVCVGWRHICRQCPMPHRSRSGRLTHTTIEHYRFCCLHPSTETATNKSPLPGGGGVGPPLAAKASQACARSGGTSWYTCCSNTSCGTAQHSMTAPRCAVLPHGVLLL